MLDTASAGERRRARSRRRAGRGRRRGQPAARSSPRRDPCGPRVRPRSSRSGRRRARAGAGHARAGRRRVRAGARSCRRRGAVLEQDPEALRALGLGRVIQRLAVVGTRPRLEQRGRELGVVLPSSSAVERRHLAVLVDEERVRVGAAREQVAGDARWCRSTNGTRRGAEPNRAGRLQRSRRRASLGPGRGAPTGRLPARAGRGGAPRLARAARRSPRERTSRRLPPRPRPAPASSDSRARGRARAGPERGSALVRRAARAPLGRPRGRRRRAPSACLRSCSRLSFTTTSLRRSPLSASPGGRRDRVSRAAVQRGGLCPARGPDAPSTRSPILAGDELFDSWHEGLHRGVTWACGLGSAYS